MWCVNGRFSIGFQGDVGMLHAKGSQALKEASELVEGADLVQCGVCLGIKTARVSAGPLWGCSIAFNYNWVALSVRAICFTFGKVNHCRGQCIFL